MKKPASSSETYYMTGEQKSVVIKGKRRVVGKAPELGMGYIVKETRYIHGENFYIPDDEMEQLLAGAVGRALRRREKALCQHPAWSVWQRFEDMDQRNCLTCGKMEYK